MTTREVTLVRIYLREGEQLLNRLIKFLHDEAKVRGVTVLGGIEGFSENGKIRSASLVALSLDLPLIVEFYDEPLKAEGIISALVNDMHLNHIISQSVLAHGRF